MNIRKATPFLSLFLFIPIFLFFVNNTGGNSNIHVNVDTGDAVYLLAIVDDVVKYTPNEDYVQLEVSYVFNDKSFDEIIYVISHNFDESYNVYIYVDEFTGKPTTIEYTINSGSNFSSFSLFLMYVPTICVVCFTIYQRYKKMKYDPFKDSQYQNDSNYFDDQYSDTQYHDPQYNGDEYSDTQYNDNQYSDNNIDEEDPFSNEDCKYNIEKDDPFDDFYNKNKK